MATTIKFKRGTRTNLNSLATSNALVAGEPVLITDEDRIAVCTSDSTYEEFAKVSEAVASGMTNPMTTSGDTIYGGASGIPTRLPKGTDGQVLKLASGVPSWANESGGGEANIIEVVQVNGTPLSVTDKTVNVVVPTQASDIGAEPANANIQSHISDATKHIDNATDEFSGTIDETNDKFTLWDNSLLKWIRFSFTSMKTWLNSLYLKLDQTTPQTINGILQNQSTAALESAPLGTELLTSSGWGATNWTGDFTTGFTHTTGNVTPLTNTLAALNATLYQISFVVTNRTAGSFTVIFGNETSNRTFTTSNAWGVKTTGTGTFSIVPTTDFNGTIVASIKRITGTYAPTYQILDSTGVSNIEIRSSLNTLNNTFIGKGAGRYNTTGSNNSAQGVSALLYNTTGSYNSAQGVQALYSNTTGSYNSAQGVNAGRYLADGITANQTSNNSIFLGSNTKSKQAGQTNEIVIGNNAIGNGSNTVTLGHTTITDTYLRGLVSAPKGVQIGDNTDVASSANKGATRYRENENGSFYEMVMKQTDGSYSWTAIVSHQ